MKSRRLSMTQLADPADELVLEAANDRRGEGIQLCDEVSLLTTHIPKSTVEPPS
jgi:hypothetical protein